MKVYSIVLLPGDGVGPEIIDAARLVLDALSEATGDWKLEYVIHPAGAAEYQRTGKNLSKQALDACLSADAVLKGPVGLPGIRRPDGTEAGLLGGVLRPSLDLYANLRPIFLYPGVSAPLARHEAGAIDYLIVRENMEGLYLSRGAGLVTEGAATDTSLMTRQGVERVVRRAFSMARARRRKTPRSPKVTCVDKSNVLRSHAFFRRIFDRVGEEEFPEVDRDYRYADAAAHDLVMRPETFDVLVMENLLGDILSDLGGGSVGGMGMCPSANIGDDHGMFEPAHGSAPGLTGKNLANPLSAILSGAWMLEWLGQVEAAILLHEAVWDVLQNGEVRINPDGTPENGTLGVAESIIGGLRKKV